MNSTPAIDLKSLKLFIGNHKADDGQHCVNEAVAVYAGEAKSDAPLCVSKVIRRFTMRLNDRWNDEDRQLLKEFIHQMVGTRGADEQRLAFMCADWSARECLPLLMDAIGSPGWAELLRALPPVVDQASAWEAASALDFCKEGLRDDAYAAAYAAAAAAYAADAADADAAYAAAADAYAAAAYAAYAADAADAYAAAAYAAYAADAYAAYAADAAAAYAAYAADAAAAYAAAAYAAYAAAAYAAYAADAADARISIRDSALALLGRLCVAAKESALSKGAQP